MRTRRFLIAGTLYLLFLALYGHLAVTANTQGILTGEEVSVSIRDVLFLQQRLQHNPMATNWGGHMLYALASRVAGDSIYYGRFFKAAAMALVPALLFLFTERTLRWRPWSALLAALSAGLMPGIMAFSWLATECGLELNGILLALMLADSERSGRRVAACALVAAAALVYPPGAFALPAVLGFTLVRLRKGNRKAEAFVLLRSAAVFLLVLCIPKLWWINDAHLLTGGGEWAGLQAGRNLLPLLREFYQDPGSYYYFAMDPPLAHWFWALIGIGGLAWSLVPNGERPRTWPLVALVLAGLAGYGLAGGVPGIRRALIVVLALHGGGVYLCDRVYAHLAQKNRPRATALASGFAAVMLASLALQFFIYRTNLNALCGHIRLPVDFAFPMESGVDMEKTVDAIYTSCGSPNWRTPRGYEQDRLCALLLWKATARGDVDRMRIFGNALFDRRD